MAWRMEYHINLGDRGGEALQVDDERGIWCLTETSTRGQHQTFGVLGRERLSFKTEEEAAEHAANGHAMKMSAAEDASLAAARAHYEEHGKPETCRICDIEQRRASLEVAP